jgi:hypothetical protein
MMASKRLFTVKYETYAVVYASSPEEAEEIAADNDFESLAGSGDSRFWTAHALVAIDDLPPGWLKHSFIVGEPSDMTVYELFELQNKTDM